MTRTVASVSPANLNQVQAPATFEVAFPMPIERINPPRILVIAQQVSSEFCIEVKEIRGHSRQSDIVQARQEVMRRAHLEGYSMPRIGRFLNRDHTTVLHGIRRATERLGAEAGQ